MTALLHPSSGLPVRLRRGGEAAARHERYLAALNRAGAALFSAAFSAFLSWAFVVVRHYSRLCTWHDQLIVVIVLVGWLLYWIGGALAPPG